MKRIKTAVVGCGSISDIYMTNLTNGKFTVMELVACSDLMVERMNASAAKFGIKAMSLDEICADPEIGMVICLTTPAAHYPIIKQALLAGKHVFSEKMIAVDLWQGKELVQIANEKGLHLGVAPDTFLGGGIQTCRRLIEDGYIGDVFGGSIHMICRGPEGWHPDPEAFYQPGAGPMFDMGPYYMTALANLLGRCSKITGFSGRAHKERIIGSGPRYGQKIPVNVDTFVCGTMLFDSGAIVDSRISFDVYCFTSDYAHIELYGTEGVLYVPDPNAFNGQIKIVRGWPID